MCRNDPQKQRTQCKKYSTQEFVWGGLTIVFFIVKSPQNLNLYQAFSSLSLYQYQNITYNDSFQQALDNLKDMNDMMNDFFLSTWLQSNLDKKTDLNNYNSFTNWKYLKTERMNSLFTQNFIVFYSTIVLLGIVFFLIFRLLFFCSFKYKVSFFFRNYSFGLFLLEYLFLGSLPDLTFLALRNFQMLFKIK